MTQYNHLEIEKKWQNLDEWGTLKKNTELEKILFFKEREIWFMRVGENIGFEQNGNGKEFLRPVVVFKKFNKKLFWGIPCTSKLKSGKYYFKITDFNKRKNTIILSQLRLFDAKRLKYKIGNIEKTEFNQIKQKIIELINETIS